MNGRGIAWVIGGVLLGSAATGNCQVSPGDAKSLLESKLKGHSLMLRGFPGKTSIPYHWSHGHLIAETQGVFAMGVLKVKSIKAHKSSGVLDTVVLEGTRQVVVRSDGTPGLSGVLQEVALRIDMRDAPPTAMEDFEKEIAFRTTDEMLNAVPKEVRDIAPASIGAKLPPALPVEHATLIERDGSWSKMPSQPGDYQPGKVLFAPEPQFSDEARGRKVSITVLLGIVVDSGGRVTETWLLRPAGLGLDEKALEAGSAYRFSPFKFKGQAVGAVLKVEVNFQSL